MRSRKRVQGVEGINLSQWLQARVWLHACTHTNSHSHTYTHSHIHVHIQTHTQDYWKEMLEQRKHVKGMCDKIIRVQNYKSAEVNTTEECMLIGFANKVPVTHHSNT